MCLLEYYKSGLVAYNFLLNEKHQLSLDAEYIVYNSSRFVVFSLSIDTDYTNSTTSNPNYIIVLRVIL